MIELSSFRIRGPLACHVRGLWDYLLSQRYTPLSAANVVRVMAHLSRWLEQRRLAPAQVTPEHLAQFLRHRRRLGYTCWRSPRGLVPILGYLRAKGVMPPAPPASPVTPLDAYLTDYRRYLQHERALAAGTQRFYADVARRFLGERLGTEVVEVGVLTATDVTKFVCREAQQWSVGHAKSVVSALRSLLRFLYLRGELRLNLAAAVPAVAGWRLTGLPRAVPAPEVQQLLRAQQGEAPGRLRDRAILLLLTRLALRACEVAALELDDLNWAAGEVRIRGKGRESVLPLPTDVGEAVAAYLKRGRPRVSSRRVFLRSRAPYAPLASVTSLVRRTFVRAGLPERGSHRLRHSAATQMLARGASLAAISQALRHASSDTTAIYAKVDRVALRTVAQPWPGAQP